MPIDLGLSRISNLLLHLTHPLHWKVIHIAGTNGKGSVCSLISSALHSSFVPVGRFTSPHLIHRWDAVTVHERPVSKSHFLETERLVKSIDEKYNIGATEFEVLTATAFEIFSKCGVHVAVVEVGMGGKEDATNVLPAENILVSVITKVGMDHEAFLGTTLKEIAAHKAGIIKPESPVVIDGSNDKDVFEAVMERIQDIKDSKATKLLVAEPQQPLLSSSDGGGGTKIKSETPAFGLQIFSCPLLGSFQRYNFSVAVSALSIASRTFPSITPSSMQSGFSSVKWPGRLEWLDVSLLIPGHRDSRILLDGAHNIQAAMGLRNYILSNFPVRKTTWIFATTQGKNSQAILELLLREEDRVFAVEFEDVDGMPWIKAKETQEIVRIVETMGRGVGAKAFGKDVLGALNEAVAWANERHTDQRNVIVTGSLYLVGQVHRLLENVRARESEKTGALIQISNS